MAAVRQFVTFRLGEGRYALPAAAVQRVVRAVEVTRLPKAPAVVLGVIDLGGHIVAVFDMRTRFGLPSQQVRLSDQLIIATAAQRTVALLVDAVDDVIEVGEDRLVDDDQVLPRLDYVEGVIAAADGPILLHDLETILSLREAEELCAALEDEAR